MQKLVKNYEYFLKFSFKYFLVSCPTLDASETPFIFLKDLNPRSTKNTAKPNIINETSKNDNHALKPKSTKPNAIEIRTNNNATLISKKDVIKKPIPMPSFFAE